MPARRGRAEVGADDGTRTRTLIEKQIFVPLRLSPPPGAAARRSWSGLSLRPGWRSFRRRPSSLYTFLRGGRRPGGRAVEGLARDWLRMRSLERTGPLAFPDFERFYRADFPAGTPIEVCCVYRFRHVRMASLVPHQATAGDSKRLHCTHAATVRARVDPPPPAIRIPRGPDSSRGRRRAGAAITRSERNAPAGGAGGGPIKRVPLGGRGRPNPPGLTPPPGTRRPGQSPRTRGRRRSPDEKGRTWRIPQRSSATRRRPRECFQGLVARRDRKVQGKRCPNRLRPQCDAVIANY